MRAPIRVALVIVGLAWPGLARAGNGGHPRTPVKWPDDVPCMTVIDRSQSSTLQFEYSIPYEDTELTPDELPTSRRHQFVAFCRDDSPQTPPPVWLSWTDANVWLDWAAEKMIDAELIEDDDVLETNPLYKDCFVRITADDARRPITEAEAMKPVVWDTTGLPAGAWRIDGYTWEPELNRWSRRPGVVHVVDGPDLAAAPPAAALTNPEGAFVVAGESYVLEGCARAMPGSTLTGYWALADSLEWQEFASQPLEGEAISLAFTPPLEVAPDSVVLRVDVTDPMQRTYSTYPVSLLSVLAPSDPSTGGCSDSGSFLAQGGEETCGDSGSTTGTSGDGPTTGAATDASSSSGEGTSDSATTSPMTGSDPSGCGCRSDRSGSAALWLLLPVLGLRRRPRAARGGVISFDR
ncbi:hypothetical protein [Nannocystis punicea]|uniref:MYXO-CTERM domain-containing protein n=1 Tax=Nannocystis punicea TaxID=2995304 RepID=A0ABY7H798_9BACT|nr:hypothetical protein [Nannocystis poenicansa]WAS95141.1 hypothetical protein O0S08_03180 [Nannocystis poenicansa]